MAQDIEQIKNVCYSKGAMDVLEDIYFLSEDISSVSLQKILDDLHKKYSASNLISGDELDEAQQKSE